MNLALYKDKFFKSESPNSWNIYSHLAIFGYHQSDLSNGNIKTIYMGLWYC